MQILLVMLPHFSLIPFYKWRAATEHTSGKLLTTKPSRCRGSGGIERAGRPDYNKPGKKIHELN